MRGLILIGIMFGITMLLPLTNTVAQSDEPVRIAAASDLKFALDSLLVTFRNTTGHKVLVTYGSSGKLFEQISNGAPFDAFFSADINYPQTLSTKGLTLTEVKVYGLGRLVVWSKRSEVTTKGVNLLVDPAIRKIAIANPRHAPYGKKAIEVLAYYKMLPATEGKLVLGENISQAAQFVYSGAADAGIIALSLAMSPNMREAGKYIVIPQEAHSRFEQAWVVLKRSKGRKNVLAFAEYVASSDAIAVLDYFGFQSSSVSTK
jgi:molybdate transport system substrate-binding protein